MSNVKRLINDGNAELIEKLSQLYEAGEMDGVIIGVKLKNGEYITGHSDTLSYLENLGLAHEIANDLRYRAEMEESE
ncbi:hypothetical protein AB1282_00395 [Gottfriedia sp. S16(2024)]|uniref:hypothetical protein n=1 Tax=Gottfriedia sp. S16(2024) TaxID=3162883 RepID=UPI003D21B6C4